MRLSLSVFICLFSALSGGLSVVYAQERADLSGYQSPYDFLDHIESDVSFGWNTFNNTPDALRAFWFNSMSWQVDLNYRQYFRDDFFSLSAGLALDGVHLRWRNVNRFLENNGTQTLISTSEALNIPSASTRRSSLSAWHVGVPIMFSIHPLRAREQSLGIGVGLVSKYTFSTVSKIRYTEYNKRATTRLRADYNINPWQVAIEGRLMIGILFFYYQHNALPFFERDTGPANYYYIHSVGIGLTTLP